MSLFKSGYGDGRKEGKMPHGTFLDTETNGQSPSGIVIQGVYYSLGGQPPTAVSHGWGNTSWAFAPAFYAP
jgi:hypothetical protein